MPDIMFQPADILDRIANFADELKPANLRPQIIACRNQLHARNGIDVAGQILRHELAALEQMLAQTQSNAPRLRQIFADLENGPPPAII